MRGNSTEGRGFREDEKRRLPNVVAIEAVDENIPSEVQEVYSGSCNRHIRSSVQTSKFAGKKLRKIKEKGSNTVTPQIRRQICGYESVNQRTNSNNDVLAATKCCIRRRRRRYVASGDKTAQENENLTIKIIERNLQKSSLPYESRGLQSADLAFAHLLHLDGTCVSYPPKRCVLIIVITFYLKILF